jgi:hypothetical protein
VFYLKKDGTENGNCRNLKRAWDELRDEKTNLFKRCLRIYCCIPDVKRNGDRSERLWVEADDSIVLYITA